MEIMKAHHDDLVAHLQACYAEAGGPISLPGLLRLSYPKIQLLLEHGVRWKWLGARILAVHQHPEAAIDVDLPDLEPVAARALAAEFSRQRRRAAKFKSAGGSPPLASRSWKHPTVSHEKEMGSGHRNMTQPRTSPARAGIHAAAALNSSIGKLAP